MVVMLRREAVWVLLWQFIHNVETVPAAQSLWPVCPFIAKLLINFWKTIMGAKLVNIYNYKFQNSKNRHLEFLNLSPQGLISSINNQMSTQLIFCSCKWGLIITTSFVVIFWSLLITRAFVWNHSAKVVNKPKLWFEMKSTKVYSKNLLVKSSGKNYNIYLYFTWFSRSWKLSKFLKK
jgi:hypothetical protein